MPSPNKVRVGQTANGLKLQFCEHIKYITTNSLYLAYSLHVHQHQCDPVQDTMNSHKKSTHIDCL